MKRLFLNLAAAELLDHCVKSEPVGHPIGGSVVVAGHGGQVVGRLRGGGGGRRVGGEGGERGGGRRGDVRVCWRRGAGDGV